MSEVINSDLPTAAAEQTLDPFEFQPGIASRIRFLGGDAAGSHPDYAFHTRYVEVAEGPASFTVRFQGLIASYGILHLRVHRFSQREGASLVLANSIAVELNRLPPDGSVSILFEGFQNVIYALYGAIVEETDARAEALSVVLDRPADPAHVRIDSAEARNTQYGTAAVKPTAHLSSPHRALLGYPISQIATEAQLQEAVAQEWVRRLAVSDLPASDRWTHAYIAQALSFYGVLQAGAHGLALRESSEKLISYLAGQGVSLVDGANVSAGQDGEGESHRSPSSAGDAAGVGSVTRFPVSLTGLSPELVNFDFLWSIDRGEDEYAAEAMARFIQHAMGCLRPGGLAVHVVAFDPSTEDPRWFSPGVLDRLALGLIGAGHEVAQFRIQGEQGLLRTKRESGPGGNPALLGIVARRMRLPV